MDLFKTATGRKSLGLQQKFILESKRCVSQGELQFVFCVYIFVTFSTLSLIQISLSLLLSSSIYLFFSSAAN